MTPSHPGPQQPLRSWRLTTGRLLILITSTLFLFAFVQANKARFGWQDSDWAGWSIWSMQLLDLEASGSLLIAALAIAYTRSQFELGLRPMLDYRSQICAESSFNLAAGASSRNFFATRLANVGGGMAAVQVASYRVRFSDQTEVSNPLTYDRVVKELKNRGLIAEKDYDLVHFSNGWTLGADQERVIFELDLSDSGRYQTMGQLQQLDIELQFEGLLKDRYLKRIYCIPRRGIETLKATGSD